MVTSKKIVKVRLSFVLYRNLKTSLEDSTPIKGFLLVWGFNGELRWLAAATGGCGWWRRSLGCWKWFWKKEGEGNDVSPRLHEKQCLKHSSAPSLGKGRFSHTPDIESKISTVRSCTSVLWIFRPNFEKIQRLTKAGGRFYRDSFG